MVPHGADSCAEILRNHFRGKTWLLGEHQLSKADATRCCESFVLWFDVILDVAPRHGLERSLSLANLIRWSDWQQIDVQVLNDACKEMLAVMRDYDPFMGKQNFKGFKSYCSDRLSSNVMFELLRPLFYKLFGGNVAVFRDLNTILQFWSRLTLQDIDWVLDEHIEAYVDAEVAMSAWTYPETLTDCLAYIVADWLSDFVLDGLRPCFSNGATAEVKRGAGIASKVLSCSRTIEQALADAELSFNSPYYCTFDLKDPGPVKGQFVPKGIDKKRFISMETTVNQYYQKALANGLQDYFRRKPQMRVKLEDQDTSRRMCLAGSRWRNYSTIDLSAASDSVTWTLVRKVFAKRPDILRYMELVRSKDVSLPNGRIITMEKFVPMGSTMCFTIECIVFSAIASYACMIAGIPQNYRVYGDDIIIDCRAFDSCIETLQRLNFTANLEKSYGPYTAFLEACGMEAYLGEDVTPCRISRRFDVERLRKMSPQQLEGSIEFANRLYVYGLFQTRRDLIALITENYSSVPFSVDPEKGIYHPDPQPWQYDTRYNRDLQLLEVKVTRLMNRAKDGHPLIRYLRTLEKYELRSEDLLPTDLMGKVRVGPTRSSLRKEWVPWREGKL